MNNTIKIIRDLVNEIAAFGSNDSVEHQVVTDTEHNHYQVVVVGWEGMKRIHGILVQIDIKGDLVWVQEDNTEYRVAEKLVERGIPKEKIVLGFHAPYKRPYTGFATGE